MDTPDRGPEAEASHGPVEPFGAGSFSAPPESGPRQLSVVHVLDTEEFAGRESVVEKLARGQVSAGLEVLVVAVIEEASSPPPFLEVAEKHGIPLETVVLPPRAYIREWKRLVDICRSVGPNVVHTHGYRPDVVGGRAAASAGVASVSTVHGFISGGWKNRVYQLLQRLSLRRFDGVVAVSRGVRAELLRHGVSESRVHLVRNAWAGDEDFLSRSEARERLSVPDDEFLVGWVGRVSREKGLDVLMESVGRPEVGDLGVSVIGEGPERRQLARRAEELPPGVAVRWHGSRRSAYRLFPAFDVVVLSSRTEGTPMVLLEAMAAEVPIVATTVGGIPDVVGEGEALLVEPEDPAGLARAIARVREHRAAARCRAEAARERLERDFDVSAWVDRYTEVYREAVSSRARSR